VATGAYQKPYRPPAPGRLPESPHVIDAEDYIKPEALPPGMVLVVGSGQTGAETGPHHHGPLESVIYVLRGRARMRWGDRLEFTAEAGPGDFIYVPPHVPHQEINASADEPLSYIVVRSDHEPVVVNLAVHKVRHPSLIE
jgi:mannose-6-phosphate isomerase-like protein (cupin superfamily)